MDAIELKTELRQSGKGVAKNLRRSGIIPGVVYGRNRKTQQIQMNARTLERVLAVAGSHQLISLRVGDQKPVMTLAREVQRDVIKRDFIHIDFYMVRMDEKVSAYVPVAIEGESSAVQDLGGVLTQNLDELEIECLPSDLVSSITVNINTLQNFNDFLSVRDLTVPDTITVLSDPDSMVVRIEAPRKVEDLEALDEEMVATSVEPEVITEGKEEEE